MNNEAKIRDRVNDRDSRERFNKSSNIDVKNYSDNDILMGRFEPPKSVIKDDCDYMWGTVSLYSGQSSLFEIHLEEGWNPVPFSRITDNVEKLKYSMMSLDDDLKKKFIFKGNSNILMERPKDLTCKHKINLDKKLKVDLTHNNYLKGRSKMPAEKEDYENTGKDLTLNEDYD